ncbi:MAG: hypothetical protein HY288_13275 [Planctomycetia bacterium]|nr:hypothetical protein [Planctomycetia bacterium]
MTFQFLCPQGHLLQGEEAHMGMQCQCPQCGMAFIIPTVERPSQSAAEDLIAPSQAPQVNLEPVSQFDPAAEIGAKHQPPPDEAKANLDFSEFAVSELGAAAAHESFLHIPCPNGHELETPLDMIGEQVLCPHCRAKFRLKREKSIEYLREQEIIDRRRARFWFQLAILAATFVGVLLLAMIAMMFVSD